MKTELTQEQDQGTNFAKCTNFVIANRRKTDMERLFRRTCLATVLLSCLQVAYANPSLPQVVYGQVNFANQGKTLTITNSPNAIIDWQKFSIAAGETTRFVQQNANSSVLNRIQGQDPSVILGSLQSNGRVFLVNPNGILFGEGSRVDVGGLVASSLSISKQDFLNGKLKFEGADQANASVRNAGQIRTRDGGQVFLIAPKVENSGIITSPHGEIMLTAGHAVQLVDSANPDLHVVVSAPENQALNLGQIVAQAGKIGIYGALIKQRGTVNADSVVRGENGQIVFKATRDAMLEANSVTSARGMNDHGGSVQVLAQRVGVTDSAQVDVSGALGGGSILLGGDFQGANPQISNAIHTYVGPNASLHADATMQGDGGKIIAWADQYTQFYGSASAHAAGTGNGGLIETSGMHGLDVAGARVDAAAAGTAQQRGKNGQWLLDPSDVTIAHGNSGSLSSGVFDPASSGTIGDYEINSALNGGTDVTIQTSGGTGGTGVIKVNGSSDVGGAVQISNSSGGARSLTLTTSGSINIHSGAKISGTDSNPLSVNLNAAGGNTIAGEMNGAGGTLSLGAATNLSGSLINTAVSTSNTLTGTSGTLDQVKIDGNVTLAGSFFVKNGLHLNSAAVLNQGTSNLYFSSAGAQHISTDSTATLNLAGGTLYNYGVSGQTLHLDSGVTLQGYGGVYESYASTFANAGTVLANTSGQALNINTANVANASGGLLKVDGGTLNLNKTNWNNAGSIQVASGKLNLNFDTTSTALGTISKSGGEVWWNGVLDNTGADLDIGASGIFGGLTANGGTIKNGTIHSGDATIFNSSGGTLDGVKLSGNLSSTGTYFISNGITLENGSVWTLSNNTVYFNSGGDQHIATNGAATLKLAGGNLMAGYNITEQTLHIDNGVTLQGHGFIGQSSAATLHNHGIIDANASSKTLTLQLDSVINSHDLSASAGTLTLHPTNWSNSGTMHVASGATLNLNVNTSTASLGSVTRSGGSVNFDGELDNYQATLDIGSTGIFGTGGLTALNGKIKFGTVQASDSTVLHSGGATLSNVTLAGNLNTSGTLFIENGLTLKNGAAVDLGNSALYFKDNGTTHIATDGTGSLTLAGGTMTLGWNATGQSLQVDSGVTVQGYGYIGVSSAASLINAGTIQANVANQTLTLSPTSLSNNNGATLGVAAGTLHLAPQTWSNSGSMSVTGGILDLYFNTSTLSLGGITRSGGAVGFYGVLDNSGRGVDIGGSGSFGAGGLTTFGGTIKNGTLVSGDGTVLKSSSGTLDGVRIAGTLDTTGSMTIKNGLTLAAGAIVNSSNNSWLFPDAGTEHIATNGTATINLNNSTWYAGYGVSGQTLQIDSGVTVQGTGYLGQSSGASLINAGTIDASVNNQALTVTLNSVNNQGNLTASAGSLHLSPTSWANSGSMHVDTGNLYLNLNTTTAALGTVSRSGAGAVYLQGTLDNTANVLDIGSSGPFGTGGLTHFDGTIKNGTVKSSDSTALASTGSGTLDGVTLSGNLQISGTTTIKNDLSLANGANIDVVNASLLFASAGTQHIATPGTASIKSDNSYIYAGYGISGQTLTLDSGITLHGSGAIVQSSAAIFNNAGTIVADQPSSSFGINVATVNNNGTLRASAGALNLQGMSSNAGTLDIAANASIVTNNANLSNAAGGVIQGNGTLNLGSATLTNNGTIAPGGNAAVGTLHLTGNFAQGATGIVNAEVGPSAGDVDKLAISGSSSLAGTLNVSTLNAFTPANNEQYTLLTYSGMPAGNFTTVNSPSFVSATTDSSTSGVYRLVMPSYLTNTWNFDGSGDWSDISKWSLGHVPTSTEDVQVPDYSGQFTINFNVLSQTARSLTFAGNDKLSFAGGSLHLLNNSLMSNASLDMLSGALNLDGHLSVGTLNLTGGQINIGSGKTFTTAISNLSGAGMLAGPGAYTVTQAFNRSGSSFDSNIGPIHINHSSGALQPGEMIGNQEIHLSASSGNIVLNGQIDAGSARASLSAAQGSISSASNSGGAVNGNQVVLVARDGIGTDAQHPLYVGANQLQVSNTNSGNVFIGLNNASTQITDLSVSGFGAKNMSDGYLRFNASEHEIVVDAPIMSNDGKVRLNGTSIIFNDKSDAYINAAGGNIAMEAVGGNGIVLPANAHLEVDGSEYSGIALTADKMNLAGMINAGATNGSGYVNLSAETGLALVVETNKGTGRLALTPTELSHISANALNLGSVTGTLKITSDLDLSNVQKLTLSSTTQNVQINHAVSLSDANGLLSVESPLGSIALGESGALHASQIKLAAKNDVDLHLASASAVSENHAAILIIADNMHLGTDGALTANGGSITLKPATEGRDIHIVANRSASASALELPANELQAVSTSKLTIGDGSNSQGSGHLQLQTGLDLTGKVGQLELASGCSNSVCGNLSQNESAGLTVSQLALRSNGAISFANAGNQVDALVAGTMGETGDISFNNAKALVVGDGSYGVSANAGTIRLSVVPGYGMTLQNPVNLGGSGLLRLESDSVQMNSTANASTVQIVPATTGRAVTLGANTCQSSPCLTLPNLYKFEADALIIGDATHLAGDIAIAGSSVGNSAVTDRHASTNRLDFYSAGNISQSGNINALDSLAITAGGSVNLPLPNGISAVAGSSVGGWSLSSTLPLVVDNLPALPGSAGKIGISTSGGALNLQTSGGALSIANALTVPSHEVNLTATGAISGNGLITSQSLNPVAGNGVDLKSAVSVLNGVDSGAGTTFKISNTGPLVVDNVSQTQGGSINIQNVGAITETGTVQTTSGAISIEAHSPLTVNGTISASNGGAITLIAGKSNSSADVLTIGSTGVVSSSGAVTLQAGNAVVLQSGSQVASQAVVQAYQNGNPPVIPPTLEACISNPQLSGCGAVLPDLNTCTLTPNTAGCKVVLPSLASCVLSPSTAGCSAVLPSLNECITTPSAAGCGVVLPTLATCMAAPTTAGCSVTLPSLSLCVSAPSTPGCSVVLPTLASCTLTPTQLGCSVVLPTLAACISAPTAVGCSVVLPTLATCSLSPTAPGCSVVLPSLASCTVTPTLPGCAVVLPSLASCSVTPTLEGCSVVLPTLASCIAQPSLQGCGVILPSLAACMANPTLPACGVVLPTLANCSATPTLEGCSVVLPSLASCIANPNVPGCHVILPNLASCMANPNLPGCSVTLPSLASCVANSALAGCSAVLPSLATCINTPSANGCSVVLPDLAQCVTSPSLSGCGVVLPSLASCSVSPNTRGCSAVLPNLNTCITAPSAQGCNVVLPSLADCVSAPTSLGCTVVLPSLASCQLTPSLPGCSSVLPAVANCSVDPLAAGCKVEIDICISNPNAANCKVLTQTTGGESTVTQALNANVNLVNATSPKTTSTPTVLASNGPTKPSTSGSNTAAENKVVPTEKVAESKTEAKVEDGKEAKKEDKKDETVVKKEEVKKEEAPVRKLYCN